jgi:hypothetical protein
MTEQPGDQPAEPTQPTEPTQRTEPTRRTEPTQPTEPVAGRPEPSAPPPADPAPAAPSSAPAAAATGGQVDLKDALQGADPFDLGIVAAGVVAFFASMLPFYTASVGAGGIDISAHISAWHGFFGWFAALLALGGAVLVALPLLHVTLPVVAHQAAVVAFGVSLLCLLLALFVVPGGGCDGVAGIAGIHCDTGHGFGYWLTLLAVLVGLGLSLVRARGARARTA